MNLKEFQQKGEKSCKVVKRNRLGVEDSQHDINNRTACSNIIELYGAIIGLRKNIEKLEKKKTKQQ